MWLKYLACRLSFAIDVATAICRQDQFCSTHKQSIHSCSVTYKSQKMSFMMRPNSSHNWPQDRQRKEQWRRNNQTGTNIWNVCIHLQDHKCNEKLSQGVSFHQQRLHWEPKMHNWTIHYNAQSPPLFLYPKRSTSQLLDNFQYLSCFPWVE